MGRIRNRRELRDQFDAAEARQREDETTDDTEEEDEEEEDEDEAGEETAEEGGEEPAEDAEEEEEVPVKKKKKVVKEPKPKRVRTPKHVRMRVVWIVYNNSNQRVHSFPYPQRKEAEEYAVKMKAESKTNQTYFVQPYKEAIEEKKE